MAPPTVETVIKRVLKKIPRTNIVSDDVLEIINECLVDIASIIDIPQLATTEEATMVAGENLVTMDSSFHKKLSFAWNKTLNQKIRVYDSKRIIDNKLSTMGTSGNVIMMAPNFPDIYFQYSPASDQIATIYFHRLPDELEDNSIFPTYIPSNFIHGLFFNYSLERLYSSIEDGFEGEKVNTLHYQDKYDDYIKKYKLFLGPDPDEVTMQEPPTEGFDFSNE